MTRFLAGMTTQGFRLPTRLLAGFQCILTVAWSMAVLFTSVRTTLECCTANAATSSVRQPAGLILQHLLATKTDFLRKIGTLRTGLIVRVAVMRRLRMSTSFRTFTRSRARGRLRATRQRRMQDRSTAVTRDLLEDRLPASIAWPFVADLRASVASAFQQPATNPSADMFSFHILVARTEMSFELSPQSLALNGLLLTRTASLRTCMASAVQPGLAGSKTLRWLYCALVADGHK